MADPKFIEQLKSIVLQRISDDDLILPPLPPVVTAARRVIQSGVFDPDAAARAIEADPLVAARLLRLAGSSAYAGNGPVIHLPGAVRRIGQRTLAAFVDEVAAETVFVSHDDGINEACRGYWEHLVATGMVARDLVMRLTGSGQEKVAEAAYLAGLIHDIGKPVLASLLLDVERRVRKDNPSQGWLRTADFVELVSSAHRTVGLLVAAKWEFPSIVRRAISDNQTFETDEPFSVPNVVRLANALCKSQGLAGGAVDRVREEQIIVTGANLLNVQPEILDEVCDDLRARVTARLG
jgi:HD-like signal output (HDOD) protein